MLIKTKYSVVINYIIVLWLAIIFSSCNSNTIKALELKLEGLEPSYLIGEKIQFSISNNSNSKLYYYISVEGFLENKWHDIVIDVDMPNSKSASIKELGVNKPQVCVLDFPKIIYPYSLDKFSKYRFEINCAESKIDKLTCKHYSKSFIVNQYYLYSIFTKLVRTLLYI